MCPLFVEMKHNLPLCFTVDPIYSRFQPPQMIKVTYNPNSPFHFLMADRTLQIDFSSERPDGTGILGIASLVVLIAGKDTEETKVNQSEPKANLSDQLECKLCILKFSEDIDDLIPLVLSCGHTICWACVEKLQPDPNLPIECPFDRRWTEDVARNLPKNRAIIEMLRDLKRMAPVTCDDPLIPCYENAQHEASRYCTTCKEDFCKSCFATVHSSRILSSHQSVPVSEKPLIPPKCQIHPDHEVCYTCTDLECQSMSKLFCMECELAEYDLHNFKSVSFLIKNNSKHVEETVKKLKEEEEKMLCQKMGKVKIAQESFDKNGHEFIQYKSAIKQHFDQKKQMALMKFEAFVDSESAKIEQGIANIQAHGLPMTALRRDLEKTLCRRQGLFDIKSQLDKAAEISEAGNEVKDDFHCLSHYTIPLDMSSVPYIPSKIVRVTRKRPVNDDVVVEEITIE